jgi:hypothetical protein
MRTAKPRPASSTERATTVFAVVLCFLAAVLLLAHNAQATAQEDFLKSMSEGVSSGGEQHSILPIILAVAAVIMLLAWLGTRERKSAKPRTVNHSRKLLKQIGRDVGLAGVEIRQLKVLADVHERTGGEPLHSPLTLLLCPSLLQKTLEAGDSRVDSAVVARMARRVHGVTKKAA